MSLLLNLPLFDCCKILVFADSPEFPGLVIQSAMNLILEFESVKFCQYSRAVNTEGAAAIKRVWIDSILRVYGSTQDVIDGPHCR